MTAFSPAMRQPSPVEGLLCARLAIYEADGAPPAVYDISAADPGALLAELGARTIWWMSRRESLLPREAVLAVVENLIHAYFRSATVSVLADGSLRVSDQGPGIPDKQRALLPGFSTATQEMRRYIRGVGSGLPVARSLVESVGGRLLVEDNLGGGTVVGLLTPQACQPAGSGLETRSSPGLRRSAVRSAQQESLFQQVAPEGRRLTARQLEILRLLAARGPAGPSVVAQQLGISLTTAFRELTALESLGLAASAASGKRRLTAHGEALVAGGAAHEAGLRPQRSGGYLK